MLEQPGPPSPDPPWLLQSEPSHLLHTIVISVATVVAFALVWRTQQSRLGARTLEVHRSEGCQFGVQPYYFEDSGSAAYNETPAEWRLVPHDPNCEPRQLIGPLLNASRNGDTSDQRLVIMFFGDRHARTAVMDGT